MKLAACQGFNAPVAPTANLTDVDLPASCELIIHAVHFRLKNQTGGHDANYPESMVHNCMASLKGAFLAYLPFHAMKAFIM